MTNKKKPSDLKGLSAVKNIIAVSSCKGGVGKSTIAVNLAYTLKKMGFKVGIFDADIYGPSLPTMLKLDDYTLTYKDETLLPLLYDGIKLMSFGYAQETSGDTGPAVMRGPMVVQIIQQLLLGTQWTDLDYLILDMPPGTGDTQLTLGQIVPITAAVIITTPQKISYVDVIKGIHMFDSIQVPTISIIENMAYFLCNKCSQKHKLFGEGTLDKFVKEFGFKIAAELPIIPEMTLQSDLGTPYVKACHDHPFIMYFDQIVEDIIQEVTTIKTEKIEPKIAFNHQDINIQLAENQLLLFKAKELRLKCQCAHCVDEFTSTPTLKPETIADDIKPLSIQKVGNYAIGVEWSDTHTSLYSYEKLILFYSQQPSAVETEKKPKKIIIK